MFTFEWKQDSITVWERDEKGMLVADEAGKIKTIEKPAVFDGHCVVKIPKHSERIAFSRGVKTKIVNGELSEDSDPQLTYAERLYEFAKSHIQEVKLVRKEDGLEFTSIEMLEYDKDGEAVLASIANMLIEGVKLKKT